MNQQSNSPDNPFKTPPTVGGNPGGGIPGNSVMQGSNYVRQVAVVAVLLIIHGLLLFLVGLGSTFFGVAIGMNPQIMSNNNSNFKVTVGEDEVEDLGDTEAEIEDVMEEESVDSGALKIGGALKFGDEGDDVIAPGDAESGKDSGDEPSEGEVAIANMVQWMYGGMGVLLLLIGASQIYAGIRNFSFKGRTAGIVALSLGVFAVFTCTCAPTSIGLAIYGFIVYLSPAVTHAFQLRKDGITKEAIIARFPA